MTASVELDHDRLEAGFQGREMAALRAGLGLVRLLVAAVLICTAAYVLSWRILWFGPQGNDTTYALHLVSWIANSFPGIDWWYRWDANGLPYREGYPLAAHWLTLAVSYLAGVRLPEAAQLVQFAVNPLCAIGVYAFLAWRLKRPLAGLVAGILYLLSPMAWTFLVDWGLYANQVGTILFMPALIALDIFFEQWTRNPRGWLCRWSAVGLMVLIALLGMISPGLLGAPLLAIPAYALAMRRVGRKQTAKWLLMTTPILTAGSLLLSAFWALPLQDYLSVVGLRQPPRVYAPDIFQLWDPGRIFQLPGFRAKETFDRVSISPAVWLPALAGAASGLWSGRPRVLAVLVAFGFISLTSHWLYAITFSVPLLLLIVSYRSAMLYLQFLLPVLAAIGLMIVPATAAAFVLRRSRLLFGLRSVVAATLAIGGLTLAVVDVAAFSERVADSPHHLAYGPFSLDSRDLWNYHHDDPCLAAEQNQDSLCHSPALSNAFHTAELATACRDHNGLRSEIPICAALADNNTPRWDSVNDRLIPITQSWCSRHRDPVCGSRFLSVPEQILTLSGWRPFRVGCFVTETYNACAERAQEQSHYRTLFPAAPERAVLDAHAGSLLMAFHDLVGGGQAYGYAFQLLPTPELDSWMVDSMLERPGTQVKAQLAAVSGADAVVLAGPQTATAAEYERLGWRQVAPAPTIYVPPHPTGLAAQWVGATTVLVVGASQSTPSHPFNEIFERATEGMIPFQDAWLVRGRSAYIDDYSDEELSKQPVILLLGYRYHNARRAWDHLDRFVQNGGRLYAETGWQYVDPDWNASSSPSLLPVGDLRWGQLDPQAPVMVKGRVQPGWGPLVYGGAGWGASSSQSARPGGDALVEVGGRVVVARWGRGKGRVLWSGMNLVAHAYSSRSDDEMQFLKDQWQWLLPRTSEQLPLEPRWSGNDEASLSVQPSAGPVAVLFKESAAPGWSAELRWPGGVRRVRIEPAEMDYMLARLDSVPDGATLVFRYGPSWRVLGSWVVSLIALAVMVAWVVRPQAFTAIRKAIPSLDTPLRHWRARWGSEEN